MCLAVYLASSQPLAESQWTEAEPAFYLELTAKNDVVRKRFSKPYVYDAGSHEGCGCGFSKDGKDKNELTECQENYAALAGVTAEAIARKAELEIFTCWEGEQSYSAKTTSSITSQELNDSGYELQQLEFLKIVKS